MYYNSVQLSLEFRREKENDTYVTPLVQERSKKVSEGIPELWRRRDIMTTFMYPQDAIRVQLAEIFTHLLRYDSISFTINVKGRDAD